MNAIPTIETSRLILRAPIFQDWPAYRELMQSERSTHMGGPYSTRDAWSWFCHDVAQWTLMGHGALMIEERASGACVGQVGINAGPLFPEHELGWFLYAEAEGNGFALEAAQAVLSWGFAKRRLKTLVSYISAQNVRSCRLAEQLGAKLDAKADRPDTTDLVFRHPAP